MPAWTPLRSRAAPGSRPGPAPSCFPYGRSRDHGQEDHRCEQHLDQLDERVAQGFERGGGFGSEYPDDSAEDDRDKDLYVEFAKYSFHDRALIFYCCQEMPRARIADPPLGVAPQYSVKSVENISG